ncbi:MAG: hypothetical protein GY820_03325 [Gammaproteobacteria bacterium]|nr:hypothetical protein [Gammaproteobacteria bacterium]
MSRSFLRDRFRCPHAEDIGALPAEDALFHWPVAFEWANHRLPRWKDAIDYWITPSDRPMSDNSDPNRSRANDNRDKTHNATQRPI